MKRSTLYILGGIGVLVILIAMIIGGTYNGMVTSREAVRTSLAGVQTQYQRRADLVPNLVSTVKGAANFEQATLTKVVEARANATKVTIDPSKATPEQLQQYQKCCYGRNWNRCFCTLYSEPDEPGFLCGFFKL